jgi:crossover junction endodeoxyribonuclease RuvC
MRLFVGIDPGLVSGTWAVIDHHGAYKSSGQILSDAGRVDVPKLREAWQQATHGQDVSYIVEDVHSMPQQGIASTYRFARAVGAIEATARLLWKDWWTVSPQSWKKAMDVTADKETSLTLARHLWPNAPLERKKDHGVAEALLLAEYLRRQI